MWPARGKAAARWHMGWFAFPERSNPLWTSSHGGVASSPLGSPGKDAEKPKLSKYLSIAPVV